jgi:uncharacterized spore protein YtfJ
LRVNVDEVMTLARDAMTVRRVFGEPFEKDGVTVIPAAVVIGGAGGGGGQDERGQEGQGGGFGLIGRPAGAYVVDGSRVRWRPAVDVNRLVAWVGMAAVVYLLRRPRASTRLR